MGLGGIHPAFPPSFSNRKTRKFGKGLKQNNGTFSFLSKKNSVSGAAFHLLISIECTHYFSYRKWRCLYFLNPSIHQIVQLCMLTYKWCSVCCSISKRNLIARKIFQSFTNFHFFSYDFKFSEKLSSQLDIPLRDAKSLQYESSWPPNLGKRFGFF